MVHMLDKKILIFQSTYKYSYFPMIQISEIVKKLYI